MNFTEAQATELRKVLQYAREYVEDFAEELSATDDPLPGIARLWEITEALPNVPADMLDDLSAACDLAYTDSLDYPGSEEAEHARRYLFPIMELINWSLALTGTQVP